MSTLLEMRIDELEEQNVALAAQHAFLIGVLQSIGQSHLEDGEAEAAESVLCHTRLLPAECLRQVRADAGRKAHFDGYMLGYEHAMLNKEKCEPAVYAAEYHASILAGKG